MQLQMGAAPAPPTHLLLRILSFPVESISVIHATLSCNDALEGTEVNAASYAKADTHPISKNEWSLGTDQCSYFIEITMF